MTLIEFTLPSFWASALMNADESGMTDDDIAAMDSWFDKMDESGYPSMHCVDVSLDGDFMTYHDASEFVLACNTAIFTFDVSNGDD